MKNAKAIVIVGSMAFDDLEFPQPIPDPEHEGQSRTSFVDVVGGSATYCSLTAACYAPVRVVAVVGEDFPDKMLDKLRGRDIDIEGIERAEGRTFRWSGRYRPDLVGRDTLDTQLNVFADFQPKLPPSYCDSPVVMLNNIHPALQLSVLDQVQDPRLVVVDTMNLWIKEEPETLAKLLERTDILVINDEEARLLSGIHNISRAARSILGRGPKRLIIKRGEHGALYFDSEGVFVSPALPLEREIDPTGCGDSFAGGLVGYLSSRPHIDHRTMRHAMLHATATASFCVEALGTAGVEALTPRQVAERVATVRGLLHLEPEEPPFGLD